MKVITSRLRKLQLRSEAKTEQLTLYPAGWREPTSRIQNKERPSIEDPDSGPKPIDINKIVKVVSKNKCKKNKKSRGGKKKQIKKNILQIQELINNCKEEEEKARFTLLLAKAKNNLNRLNKKKQIK